MLLADDFLPNPADFDGLILPGGGDISPFFYHMENKGSRNIDSLLTPCSSRCSGLLRLRENRCLASARAFSLSMWPLAER